MIFRQLGQCRIALQVEILVNGRVIQGLGDKFAPTVVAPGGKTYRSRALMKEFAIFVGVFASFNLDGAEMRRRCAHPLKDIALD